MTHTPGLLMLEDQEDVLSVLACCYIVGFNVGWLYQASKVEKTNYIESLTASEVQGASWLFATDLTCEEEQRSFLVTIKVCQLPWASHREKGSQVSIPRPLMQNCRGVQTHKRQCVPTYHTDKTDPLLTAFVKFEQWARACCTLQSQSCPEKVKEKKRSQHLTVGVEKRE